MPGCCAGGSRVIWLADVGEVAALVMVGTWISADVALGGFHSQAGSLLFIAVGLGLMLLAPVPVLCEVDATGPSRPADLAARPSISLHSWRS